MFQSLDFFLLSCLFLTVESRPEKTQNMSLVWINGFEPHLSWSPPLHSAQPCSYTLISQTRDPESQQKYNEIKQEEKKLYILMEGGFLQFTLETVCNGTDSKVVINTTNGDLVKNLKCYISSHKKAHCTWSPYHVPDLRFYYRLIMENFSVFVGDELGPLNIKECSSYIYTNGVKTGCNLEVDIHQAIHILFNGTLNQMLAWNTFRKRPQQIRLRPPPLNWTVTKTGDKFDICWTPPNIKANWTVIVSYTECDKTKNKTYSNGETSAVLELVSHCPYRMAIIASVSRGHTPWSEQKYFDADTNPNKLVYAAIIIPLVFAGLAVLICVCCRKNKENIFPKVPEPRDFLSDISDNNNKSTARNLYFPTEEEDNCKITLVVEPHTNKVGF